MLSKNKKKLRNLLAKLDPSKEAKLLAENLSEDIKALENKIPVLPEITQPKDYSNAIQTIYNDLGSLRKDILSKLENLPDKNTIDDIKKKYLSEINSLERNLTLTITNMESDIVGFNSDIQGIKEDNKQAVENLKKLIQEYKIEALSRGGGSQNQRIMINSSVMSSRYADINLLGSITKTDNKNTKQVDITFSPGGSQTPWTSDIDGNSKNLSGVNEAQATTIVGYNGIFGVDGTAHFNDDGELGIVDITNPTTHRGIFDLHTTADDTIADVTTSSVGVGFTQDPSYLYPADGVEYAFDIYSFKFAPDGIKMFSANPLVQSGFAPSSGDNFKMDTTWDAVTGADGYRVVAYDPYWGDPGLNYIDTTYTSILIGDVDSGYDSVSGQYYTYADPMVVTPSSPYDYFKANIYVDRTNGDLISTKSLDFDGNATVGGNGTFGGNVSGVNGTFTGVGVIGSTISGTGQSRRLSVNAGNTGYAGIISTGSFSLNLDTYYPYSNSTHHPVIYAGSAYGSDSRNYIGIAHTSDSSVNNALLDMLEINGANTAQFNRWVIGRRGYGDNRFTIGFTTNSNLHYGVVDAGFNISSDGKVGITPSGTNALFSAAALLHLKSTTEQLRVGYDASNYFSTTVGSTGGVTFNAVGSGAGFTFSDPVTINGLLTLSAQNIATDTTTGTKIGTATTQKLGFFNATPIVQVGATTDLGVVLSNLGLRASGTAYPITTSGAVTLGSLTAGRVPFAGTAGLLQDDSDFTFSVDTLTSTKMKTDLLTGIVNTGNSINFNGTSNRLVINTSERIDMDVNGGAFTWTDAEINKSNGDFTLSTSDVLNLTSGTDFNITGGDFVTNVSSLTFGTNSPDVYWINNSGEGTDINFHTDGDTASFVFYSPILAETILRLKNYTVATLPGGLEGAMVYITDGTVVTAKGVAPVGGGSARAVVFYNGGAWVGI